MKHFCIIPLTQYGNGCTGFLLLELNFWEFFLSFVLYLLLCIFLSVVLNISTFVNETSARISWRTSGERSDLQLYVAIMNHRKNVTPQSALSGFIVYNTELFVNCRLICSAFWKASSRAATKNYFDDQIICRLFLRLSGYSTFWLIQINVQSLYNVQYFMYDIFI